MNKQRRKFLKELINRNTIIQLQYFDKYVPIKTPLSCWIKTKKEA